MREYIGENEEYCFEWKPTPWMREIEKGQDLRTGESETELRVVEVEIEFAVKWRI